jgi:hypothetical protein
MSTPQTEEYLEARRESCRLLGLNADDLTPHEMIRADLLTVLRLWLDGSQSALLSGGTADPTKILAVADVLGKLVPEPEHKSRGKDPRDYMWRTYSEMRRRGEIGNAVVEAREVDRLRARVAELEAQLAERSDVPVEPAPAPAGDNVVKLRHATSDRAERSAPPEPAPPPPAAASAPVAGELVMVVDASPQEPWRDYVEPDGSIRSTPFGGGKYWGPV